MAKHKGDIEIGYRMVEELYRIFGTQANAVRRFKVARSMFAAWGNGRTPGGFELAKLHYSGGDVIYVLTGRRRICNADT